MSLRHVLVGVPLSVLTAIAVGCVSSPHEFEPGGGGSAPGGGAPGGGSANQPGGGASALPSGGTTAVPGGGSAGVPGGGTTGLPNGGTSAGGGGSPGGGSDPGVSGSGGGGAGGSPPGGPYTVPRGKSLGCGKNSGDEPGVYTSHDIEVTGVDPYWLNERTPYPGQAPYTFTHRAFSIRLPAGYDPTKAYPLVFQGGGCGNTSGTSGKTGGTSMIPNSASGEGIAVGLSYVYPDGAGACFADEYENTYELQYWDAVYKRVTEDYCVDLEKVFIGGYSSGAWMAYSMSFARSGKIRGMGAGAGGIREKRPPASDVPFAAMLITGIDDGGNPIHKTKNGTTCSGTEAEGCWAGKIICGFPGATDCVDTGSAAARDHILERNGCVGTATVQHGQWPECKRYTGCPAAFPVVYCTPQGGHTDGGERLNPGVWDFWKALPPVP